MKYNLEYYYSPKFLEESIGQRSKLYLSEVSNSEEATVSLVRISNPLEDLFIHN